jgi:hypothetical protein
MPVMPASDRQFLLAHRSLYFYHGMKEEAGVIEVWSAFSAWVRSSFGRVLQFREISLHDGL